MNQLDASGELCPGSGRYLIEQAPPTTPVESWTARCPSCGGVFELGYAGFMPPHDKALGADQAPSTRSRGR